MRNIMILLCCMFGFTARGQGEKPVMQYTRPLFDFDTQKPLFSFNPEQRANANRYLRYHALTSYREGVPSTAGPFGVSFGTVDDPALGTRLLYMYNLSIAEMVSHRAGEYDRIIFEVKDPLRYRYVSSYGPRAEWLKKYGFCFEVLLPVGNMDLRLVDTLLSKALGISWGLQKRTVNALVLYRLSKAEKFKSKNNGMPGFDGRKTFLRINFEALGQAMAADGRPFIDETQYRGLADVVLEVKNPKDLAEINRQLKRYDLAVKEESRELKMLVVKELNDTRKYEQHN
jgi:hypothetical protein